MEQTHKERRITELTEQMRVILEELSFLQPPDIVTLVLALPVDLAGYMADLAPRTGAGLGDIYATLLAHGAVHEAAEDGDLAAARTVARMIRRLADDATWHTFLERHPEVEQQGGS